MVLHAHLRFWTHNINKLHWLIAISFCNIQNIQNMMLYIEYAMNIMVDRTWGIYLQRRRPQRPHGPLLISQEALPVERLLTLWAMSWSEYPMDWKQGSQLIESADCRILWTQFLTLQMQMFHKMNVRIVSRVLFRLGACCIRGISQTKEKSICKILQNMLNM